MKSTHLLIFGNLLLAAFLMLPLNVTADTGREQLPQSVKLERNHVRSGNKLYKAGRYSEAEVHYRKALEANPRSAMAQFNLASSLLRQETASKPATGKQQGQASNRRDEAVQLLTSLAENCAVKSIAGKANYDLGNLAYKQQQYGDAIELYKNALRKNPRYDDARYNLRLAQLKQKQSKNNKNNDNKKKQDKKNKDKNKNKQQQDKNKNRNPQQPKQQPSGMSRQNMDQILRTMQNQENATQQRLKEKRARMEAGERVRTKHKW